MSCIHDYDTIKETKEAILEVCKICKKRLLTKLDKKGRHDIGKYLKEHVRDTCQPNGRTKKIFEKLYGKKH